jgi:uncharacterized protein YbcC (UPF0753/DUF2309 family)
VRRKRRGAAREASEAFITIGLAGFIGIVIIRREVRQAQRGFLRPSSERMIW